MCRFGRINFSVLRQLALVSAISKAAPSAPLHHPTRVVVLRRRRIKRMVRRMVRRGVQVHHQGLHVGAQRRRTRMLGCDGIVWYRSILGCNGMV